MEVPAAKALIQKWVAQCGEEFTSWDTAMGPRRAMDVTDDARLILKAHVLVEHFMNELLSIMAPALDLNAPRLSFHTKMCLLGKTGTMQAFGKCVSCMNEIRNRVAHTLSANLVPQDAKNLRIMMELLRGAGIEAGKLTPGLVYVIGEMLCHSFHIDALRANAAGEPIEYEELSEAIKTLQDAGVLK